MPQTREDAASAKRENPKSGLSRKPDTYPLGSALHVFADTASVGFEPKATDAADCTDGGF
ncbi:MAG: hypothetical protein HRU32_10895 [Rhodobacteraceae bacterium]|nr:hypothetical protein [Paracoccaceae bacterium]